MKTDISRRKFFKAVGLGTAGVVGAALIGPASRAVTDVAAPTAQATPASGYQVTKHVQTYYQTARL